MLTVASNVTDVPLQITFPGVAVIVMVGVTEGFTVIEIEFEPAVGVDKQPALDVIVQATTSPVESVLDVKEDELLPALEPFTVH